MRIAIGADHRGYALKEYFRLMGTIGSTAVEWINMGTDTSIRTDYPIFARRVAKLVACGEAERGLLLCGTGIGMAIAANRYKGIYAGVLWNPHIAAVAREDDKVNVAVLPTDYVSESEALLIVKAWLMSEFKEDRYAERLAMIDQNE